MAQILERGPHGNVGGLTFHPESHYVIVEDLATRLMARFKNLTETIVGLPTRVETIEGGGHFEDAPSAPTLVAPPISSITTSWWVKKVANRRRPSLSLPASDATQVSKSQWPMTWQ